MSEWEVFLGHLQVCFVGLLLLLSSFGGAGLEGGERISVGLWFDVQIDFMVIRGILAGCSCLVPFIMFHGCLNKGIFKWGKCIPWIPIRRATT